MGARGGFAGRLWSVAVLGSGGLAALLFGLTRGALVTGRLDPQDWLPGGILVLGAVMALAYWRGRRMGMAELALLVAILALPPLLFCALAGVAGLGLAATCLPLALIGMAIMARGIIPRWPRAGWALIMASALAAWFAPTLMERTPSMPRGPAVAVMTALPLHGPDAAAGDSGPVAGAGSRSPFWIALGTQVPLRAIDALDAGTLRGARSLLLAQPRLLAPEELVLLDGWVRRGGRAVILADPLLLWPDTRPLGHPRRPPLTSLLDPLLAHWGLRLEPADGRRVAARPVERRFLADGTLLALAGASRFAHMRGGDCVLAEHGLIARCALGHGHVLLLADADLINPALWTDDPLHPADLRHWRADSVAWLAGAISPGLRVEARRDWVASDDRLVSALRHTLLLLALMVGSALLLNLFPRPPYSSPMFDADQKMNK